MKRISLRAGILFAAAALFIFGLAVFVLFYVSNATDWAMYTGNTHLYTNGVFTGGGEITDRHGVVLAQTKKDKRVFNSNSDIRLSTLHVVGDANGFISTGAHTAFRKQLSGYNFITGLFSVNGGHNDLQLTIDADVCAAAYRALGSYYGTVGLYDYKTGKTICMVSTPSYDVNSKADTERAKNGDYEGVFMNRFISSSYAPGSTFKIITAAAAIDTFGDAYTRTYRCEGGCKIGGETVKCTGWHNDISLKQAFAVSCNSYFSQLAVDLGKEKMTEYAEKFGFNKKFSIDGIEAKRSSYNVEKARKIQLGWSGIGQYNDMQNPLQYLTVIGGIANGGTPVKPYLIDSVRNSSGIVTKRGSAKKASRVCSDSTAKKLQELMDGAVAITYGKSFFTGLDVCGKTGTAEVDGKTPHAEFVGFCTDEKYPFAFVVVVEEGGSGNYIAKWVANQVLQAAKKSYDKSLG